MDEIQITPNDDKTDIKFAIEPVKFVAALHTLVAALDIAIAQGDQFIDHFATRGYPIAAARYQAEMARMPALREIVEMGIQVFNDDLEKGTKDENQIPNLQE